MPKPYKHRVTKAVAFERDLFEQIESWRRHQKPPPSMAEAIRRLVREGLKAKSN